MMNFKTIAFSDENRKVRLTLSVSFSNFDLPLSLQWVSLHIIKMVGKCPVDKCPVGKFPVIGFVYMVIQ